MTTPDADWPIDPDQGIPPTWDNAVNEVQRSVTPNAIQAAVQRAEALRLLDDMKFRRVIWRSETRHWANSSADEAARHTQMKALMEEQTASQERASRASSALADAANRQTAALVQWTKWLVIATTVLAVATIVLVAVTASGS